MGLVGGSCEVTCEISFELLTLGHLNQLPILCGSLAEKISIDVVYSLRDASDTKIADLTTIRGIIPLRFRTPNNIAQRKGANEKEATLAGRLQLLKKRLTSRYPECNIPDPGAFNAGLVEDQFFAGRFPVLFQPQRSCR